MEHRWRSFAFDVLQVQGREMMNEPWTDRRKRLEDVGAILTIPNVRVVPVTDDAAHLWSTWVGWGGEGIVLKDRRSCYRPGLRSPDWLKVKHRHTLPVHVVGGDSALVRWGRLELGRTGDADVSPSAVPAVGAD